MRRRLHYEFAWEEVNFRWNQKPRSTTLVLIMHDDRNARRQFREARSAARGRLAFVAGGSEIQEASTGGASVFPFSLDVQRDYGTVASLLL